MSQINYSTYLSAMKELMDAKVFELCPYGYPEAFIRPVVLYGETFYKCYSGGESIDTIEQALELYDLWKQYDRVGVVAWLAKRKGFLPLYWEVDIMKEAGFDVASLNLPENPSDVYYKAQYRVAMSGTELSKDEIQKLMDEVDLGWKKIRNHDTD